MKLRTGWIFTLLMVGCISSANAALIRFYSDIDGAQADAGAGTGSPGVGTARATFDENTNEFAWNVSWSGLQGTLTVAHFHGPAGPLGSAGVVVDFLGLAPGNPSVGSATISDEEAVDLLADMWYVNIHSTQFPAGEIRGQLERVPLPSTVALFGLGILGLIARRRA